MSDRPKKPKIPRAFNNPIDSSRIIPPKPKLVDHPLFSNPYFNCRSSMIPISDEGRRMYLMSADERKPWIQHPHACVIPGVVLGDRQKAQLVASVLATNYWLSEFCRKARELYPIGGVK